MAMILNTILVDMNYSDMLRGYPLGLRDAKDIVEMYCANDVTVTLRCEHRTLQVPSMLNELAKTRKLSAISWLRALSFQVCAQSRQIP